jgi:glutathione S-transferase
MEKITLIVCLALFEYIYFAMKVGFSRRKYNVIAPATSGHPEWERLNRIHLNTLEVYIIFIPSIFGFAYYVSEFWAVILGSMVLLARIIFYLGYKKDAKKRMPGVFMTSFCNYTMLIGTFYACVQKVFFP